MNLAISESELPVRLRFERPLTDQELMRFSAANELLRVEREANGELLIMTPTVCGWVLSGDDEGMGLTGVDCRYESRLRRK